MTGLAFVAIGLGAGLFARAAGIHPVRIVSASMAPTVKPGEWIVVSDIGRPRPGDFERDDIVMFRFPLGSSGRAIKRVVAVGGDRIAIDPHRLTINGRTTSLAGAPSPRASRRRTEVVPPGSVYLVGDNAKFSIDSRSFGAVPLREIVARRLFTPGTTGRMILTGALMASVLAIGGLGLARIRTSRRSREVAP